MKKDLPLHSALYTPLEIEGIKKVFDMDHLHDEDPLNMDEKMFTEHPLDETTNSIVKNLTTKSIVLAPYNSSKEDIQGEIDS
jgi:hypothetical protein